MYGFFFGCFFVFLNRSEVYHLVLVLAATEHIAMTWESVVQVSFIKILVPGLPEFI